MKQLLSSLADGQIEMYQAVRSTPFTSSQSKLGSSGHAGDGRMGPHHSYYPTYSSRSLRDPRALCTKILMVV